MTITIDKAIEKLQDLNEWLQDEDWIEDSNAVELSIEALNRIRNLRLYQGRAIQKLLPGETKKEA